MTSTVDPLVDIKLGNDVVKFLVDTGTSYSMLNSYKGPMSKYSATRIGATGRQEVKTFFPTHYVQNWQQNVCA